MITKHGSNNSRKTIPITGCQPIRYSSKQITAASSNIDMKAVNIHLGASSILCTSFEIRWITLPVVVSRRLCWLISGIYRPVLKLVNIKSLRKNIDHSSARKYIQMSQIPTGALLMFIMPSIHHKKKKMEPVHFTTIPCEPNLAHWAYTKIWFNGSRSYSNNLTLVEFKWLTFFLCVFIRSLRVFVRNAL